MVFTNELDWALVDDVTATAKTKFKFAEVEHLMRKVAFDRYKPLSGSETLWELRDEEGEKFLYAVYEEAEDLKAISTKTAGWEATADKSGANVTLSFKRVPLMRFAAAQYDFSTTEAEDFASFLSAQANQEGFAEKIMAELPVSKREMLVEIMNRSEA